MGNRGLWYKNKTLQFTYISLLVISLTIVLALNYYIPRPQFDSRATTIDLDCRIDQERDQFFNIEYVLDCDRHNNRLFALNLVRSSDITINSVITTQNSTKWLEFDIYAYALAEDAPKKPEIYDLNDTDRVRNTGGYEFDLEIGYWYIEASNVEDGDRVDYVIDITLDISEPNFYQQHKSIINLYFVSLIGIPLIVVTVYQVFFEKKHRDNTDRAVDKTKIDDIKKSEKRKSEDYYKFG